MHNYFEILRRPATKVLGLQETQKYLCDSDSYRNSWLCGPACLCMVFVSAVGFLAKRTLKLRVFMLFALLFAFPSFSQERKFTISGVVTEEDSSTTMPYVYLINHTNGNGTITDYNGRFSLIAENSDTLVFSYLGFARKKYPVSLIKNLSDSTKKPLKVVMHHMAVNLSPVTAFSYKVRPNEVDYMKRYIKQTAALKGINAIESPITALYDMYSRKGKEKRKLQQIFEQILMQEEVAKKFNPEILRQLTEDEFIDYDKFRRYCWRISDEYILSHDGYDLYAPIMDCYRQWKRDGK